MARTPRVLTLRPGQHDDASLLLLRQGDTLRFRPAPDLLGRRVYLYTNYVLDDPKEEEGGKPAEFVRTQYSVLEWQPLPACEDEPLPDEALSDEAPVCEDPEDDDDLPRGAGALLTSVDVHADVLVTRAGPYHYYFVYDTPESKLGPAGSGWFQVEPELRAGGAALPLEAVSCQTVLTKCLGPLARWEAALAVSRDAGYNMVHLTPVQQLGASRSAYSLADRLRLDPALGSPAAPATFAALDELLTRLRAQWRMLFICDVVLNHTANETPWLAAQPAASYNCATCPWLRPAALLDAAVARFGAAAARGELEPELPRAPSSEEHVAAARRLLLARALPAARLHELFACDAPRLERAFTDLARGRLPAAAAAADDEDALRLLPDPARRRLRASVDMELALRAYNVRRADCADEDARLRACAAAFRRRLDALNAAAEQELAAHLAAAADNVAAGLRYERVAADGPRLPDLSERHPLAPRYFAWPADPAALSWEQLDALLAGDDAALVMAHNGWVMGADPLQDFAARDADGRVYLRRELVAWGDSVKLRYGARPEDSPFLWAHMREYVERCAELFDGVRLDNCHSTPLHVAEYMMDAARNVNRNLYVMAELFTNSPAVDCIFVNRLGVTALVRECAAAHDARELGRLLHRWSGPGVGALLRDRAEEAARSLPRAVLYDVTHDNPSPVRARGPQHVAALALLLAAAACASGSTRGLDHLVPDNPHVVDEERLYPAAAGEGEEDGAGVVARGAALAGVRRAATSLHAHLALDSYSETYVDQMDDDVIAVTRHNPETHESVIVVVYTAFRRTEASHEGRAPPPLRFEGELHDELLLELGVEDESPPEPRPHPRYIVGREARVQLRRRVPLQQSAALQAVRRSGALTEVTFRPLRPGAAVALRVRLRSQHAAALAAPPAPPALSAPLHALHALLYRCDAEERACGGGGVYDVPGAGPLPYAGLQGAASALAGADLDHPLCANLRAGDWLPEYVLARLRREPALAAAAAAAEAALRPALNAPRYLVPALAVAALRALAAAARAAALRRMPRWLRRDSFGGALALTSVQLLGAVPGAALPLRLGPSLSAGLPHFAVGYMRCWGRDTFISLRGLLLLTGRFQDARAHILAFASCLRHGLIPNLLDGGYNARYNSRDAVWWWLQSIKYYCEEAPQGYGILSEPVARLFPTDEAAPAAGDTPDVVQPLSDVMQEALQRHFQGVTFRERGAGRGLDAHMSDQGFTVQLGVQPDTGFPFGGNDHNCGTWMDKMGSSEAAGTRGKPATPRDGAAVELVALAYSVTAWLAAANRAGRYPAAGVQRQRPPAAWTYAQWSDAIRRSFERHYWVPAAPSAADARPDLVHRRAIYKDTLGATRPWADYQLRPNFVVAMAVAPQLFDPRHAWLALDQVERLLLGPLGVRTLDPADWNYRGDYEPAAGGDPATADGYNYHQGPEWLWPLGFYVRARLHFAQSNGQHARAVAAGYAALAPHAAEVAAGAWRGLPELTNRGGAYCAASCRSQAWSSASALEALAALRAARRTRALPAP